MPELLLVSDTVRTRETLAVMQTHLSGLSEVCSCCPRVTPKAYCNCGASAPPQLGLTHPPLTQARTVFVPEFYDSSATGADAMAAIMRARSCGGACSCRMA